MLPPALLIAVALSIGVALREMLGLSNAAAVGLALAGALALGGAVRAGRGEGSTLLLAAAALGALLAAGSWPVPAPELCDGNPWQVTARVTEGVERIGGKAHVLVEIEAVRRDGRSRRGAGLVRLSLGGDPIEPLLPGDRVLFRARLLPLHGFHEPGAPDPERRLVARGASMVAGVPTPVAVVRLLGDERGGVRRRIAGWRVTLLERVRQLLDGDRRRLVASLVLGERGDISRSLDDAFRRIGASHVLSVSGLHLAIATALFFVVLARVLGWIEPLVRRVAARQVAAALSIPAVLLYTEITGAAVATVRSCVVAVVWLSGIAIGRPASALSALGWAAVVILAGSPLALYDPSFQLSFAAALGGVVLVSRWLGPLRAGWRWGRLAWSALQLAATSAAAIAATAPLCAYHFGQVAPIGLISNLAVVPLAELWVVPVGLAGCALLPLAGWAAALLVRLAGVGAALTALVVRWFAAWAPPGNVPAPSWVETTLWYAALVVSLRRPRWALLLAGLGAGSLAVRHALPPRALTAHFLDVGQGDAAFIELPGGRTLLIDGGGSFDPAFDPGETVIGPWLVRQGVGRLDAVVLTHPHPDHVNGLAALVERFPVGEIWTNGAPSDSPGLGRLEEVARRRGVPIRRPRALDWGGARLDVVHPLVGGEVAVPAAWSENDGSVVLRLSFAGRTLLLAGDVEARAEEALLTGTGSLRADVLKAPHHCSRTSSTPGFVAAVRPSLVVCSVGAFNRWHFPADEVVERYRQAGARILRTDRDGAVTVTVRPDGHLEARRAHRSGIFE